MKASRRGFLGLMAGAGVAAAAGVNLAAETDGRVTVKHERAPKSPALWNCTGFATEGDVTLALTVQYTEGDCKKFGRSETVAKAEEFVRAQLTGPERDFFRIEGSERPLQRARWIGVSGALDWRQMCPMCLNRMDSWRGSRCGQCNEKRDPSPQRGQRDSLWADWMGK